MQRLSSIIFLLFLPWAAISQSPHGDGLTIDCAKCHHTGAWTIDRKSISFMHEETGFTLTGAHENAGCADCHVTLVFDEAQSECASCHTDMHNMSVGNDCARCHTTGNWLVDNIPELHEMNGFQFIGVHSIVSCEECHSSETNLRFDPIGNECENCHLDDYQNTRNPNHVEAGYSTDCMSCHDPISYGWDTEVIDHTFFPLTLGHDIADCYQCHTKGNFSAISTYCFACHQKNYEQTVNPSHRDASIPNDCVSCHTTDPGWHPATFDIHNNYYQLNGAHAAIATGCATCHNDNYSNTPNTCVGCHQNDYDNTSNPKHVSVNFPTDCEQCHTEDAWSPASFNHDGQFFPIYSGKHKGKWDTCTDCHTSPDNYAVFSCFACHPKNKMDDKHKEYQGYAYDSNTCLQCHPDGSK